MGFTIRRVDFVVEAQVERQLTGNAPVVQGIVVEFGGEHVGRTRNEIVLRGLGGIAQQHGSDGIAASGGRRGVVGEIAIEIEAAKSALRRGRVGLADHVIDHIDTKLETVCSPEPIHVADVFYPVLTADLWLTAGISQTSKPGWTNNRSRVTPCRSGHRLVARVRASSGNLRKDWKGQDRSDEKAGVSIEPKPVFPDNAGSNHLVISRYPLLAAVSLVAGE
jgi:hypothetical protein